jgi:hypothetical protein
VYASLIHLEKKMHADLIFAFFERHDGMGTRGFQMFLSKRNTC